MRYEDFSRTKFESEIAANKMNQEENRMPNGSIKDLLANKLH